MSDEIIKGTQVQIVKPPGDIYNWPPEQRDVGWNNGGMDRYVGHIYTVERMRRDGVYLLRDIPSYVWHRDWLIVLGKNGEPFDNTGRTKCFWCNGYLKFTKEKSASGLLAFTYCPKCGR